MKSAMVRHHYGPWDKRYYHVLAHLEARGLIRVTKEKRTFRIALTDIGRERAQRITALPSFTALVARMKKIKKTLAQKAVHSSRV